MESGGTCIGENRNNDKNWGVTVGERGKNWEKGEDYKFSLDRRSNNDTQNSGCPDFYNIRTPEHYSTSETRL